jgi:hypothetical protein
MLSAKRVKSNFLLGGAADGAGRFDERRKASSTMVGVADKTDA